MLKKVIVAPDSFKGSISAEKFCEIAEKKIRSFFPNCDIITLPIADGGEGTLDCLLASVSGNIVSVETKGPFNESLNSEFLITDDGTAVIEIAKCVGLPLVKGREDPERTSTFGIGKLIEEAVMRGAERVILTLGGSSTNDCGAGMLSALGACFFDRDGKEFVPTGGSLGDVFEIKLTDKFRSFGNIKFIAMCDVTNPLCGDNGCAAVFARQKGADDEMIKRLDKGALSFASVCSRTLGKDHSNYSGAGAAGGLGFACSAFLGGELKSGIETILELTDFDRKIENADIIITGEGSFDEQSMMGKVIGGIASHASTYPVAVLCGRYQPFDYEKYKAIKYIIPISDGQNTEYAMSHAEENLANSLENLMAKLSE